MGAAESSQGKTGEKAKRRKLIDDYRMGKVLGDGAFGQVYACYARTTNQEYAVKMVDKVETPVASIKKEADMLKALNHENIVKVHDVIYDKLFVCIVMDWYKGGDVVDGIAYGIKEKGKLTADMVKNVIFQMVSSVRYLHNNVIVHRDVKGDNYLMDKKDITDPTCHIALSDFGTAKSLKDLNERMTDISGTKLFWSPEFHARNYGIKVDMWAIGVTMCTILNGKFPFKNDKEVREKVIELPKGTSELALTFARSLLQKDEKNRATSDAAIGMEYIKGCVQQTMAPTQQSTNNEDSPTEAEKKNEGLREGGAGIAAQDRRRELVERIESAQDKSTKFPTPGTASEADRKGDIWGEQFTRVDRRGTSDEVTHEYKWDNESVIKSEPVRAPRRTSVVAKSEQTVTTTTVKAMLAENGIKAELFRKDVSELVKELQHGTARLMLNAAAEDGKQLVRVVDIVVVRIVASTGREFKYLIEMSTDHSKVTDHLDNRNREVSHRLPAMKKEPEENTKMTVSRILKEKLNLVVNEHVELSLGIKKEFFELQEDSHSYPGLSTVYRKEIVEAHIVPKGAEATKLLSRMGLPEGNDWTLKDEHDTLRSFAWMTEKQCEKQKIQLRPPEDEDISGLVMAPVGLSEDELRKYLTQKNVNTSQFDDKGIKELATELQRGECNLVEEGGQVLRVVDLVVLRLFNDNGQMLVDAGKITNDGQRKASTKLPGAKSRPDENQFHTAWRIIKRGLKIDENYVTLDAAHVKVVEEETDSTNFPGLRTRYMKRVIRANLDKEPETPRPSLATPRGRNVAEPQNETFLLACCVLRD